MNLKRTLSGVVVWSVGLAIPLLYHVLLMHAAVQEDAHSYTYHVMVKYFFALPWILWPYMVGTAIVGTWLVISGLRDRPNE